MMKTLEHATANDAPRQSTPPKEFVRYKKPRLTKLEEFVYANEYRGIQAVATELNRTEAEVCKAFNRADDKLKECAAIEAYSKIGVVGFWRYVV